MKYNVKLNLNENITFKPKARMLVGLERMILLSPDYLKEYYEGLLRDAAYAIHTDSTMTMQLWSFMKEFGHEFSLGAPEILKTLYVTIERHAETLEDLIAEDPHT